MSRRGDFDPDENETKEFEVPADTSAEDESSHIEEIPVIEESSIRDDPLGGETAAAAWAAGATPSPEMIPVDRVEPKEDTLPDASEASKEGEGLRPFTPEGESEPTEPAEPGPFAPVAERRPVASEASVWDEDEVLLPGAVDPLLTPQHVEPGPGAYAATQTAEEAPEDDTPSSDLLITERGHTIITPRVVEKIAGRAASEVDGVGGVQSSGLGRFTDLFSGSEKRETQAHAEVHRASTVVDLVVSVRYPEPVGAVANHVREHVVSRLHELTGLQVGEVNVSIPELVVPDPPPPRPRVI